MPLHLREYYGGMVHAFQVLTLATAPARLFPPAKNVSVFNRDMRKRTGLGLVKPPI